MKTTPVTVIHPFVHEGRNVEPGEVLDVRPVEAASLKYRGVAKLGGYRTAALEPINQAHSDNLTETGGDFHAASSAASYPASNITNADGEPLAAPTRRRRQYRRRDLTAEE